MPEPIILDAAKSKGRGIRLTILGDSGPFSIVGKSICYLVEVKGAEYMFDIAAPVFQLLGTERIDRLRGVFVTHAHDDHKRTFTDVALYYRYSEVGKTRLITTEDVHGEIKRSSVCALENSLSLDSKRVISLPYDDFVEQVFIGPKARANILYRPDESGAGRWVVIDENGAALGPQRAKLVFHPQIEYPRLLYRDPETGLWVEPASYYSFDDNSFYLKDQRDYVDESAGLRVQAIKAASWHGMFATGYKFFTESETLMFSSDTVYNPGLWRQLASERRPQKLPLSREEFENTAVLYGDINDLIELTWSQKRLLRAMDAYSDSVVMHDVADPDSIVHTDYALIAQAPIKTLLLTHSPDDFVSLRPLSSPGKVYRILGDELYAEVKGKLYPEVADVYSKQGGANFVGFAADKSKYSVVEVEGSLKLVESEKLDAPPIMKVELYHEIGGGYYPLLQNSRDEYYRRPDGEVVIMRHTGSGSSGRIVKDLRAELTRKKVKA